MQNLKNEKKVIEQIQRNLTSDLLKGKWRGHCYVASEALYHLIGGKPAYLNHELWPEGLKKGETHWFIFVKGKPIDLTAHQFKLDIPYEKGKGCGFLTKQPSKRCRVLLKRINGI